MSDFSSDSAIELRNISVRYRVAQERIGTLKEYILRRLQGKVTHNSFYALRAVNLEIRKGEVFGLVGRNGAGKSTLLKVISRVLVPTTGRVIVRGQVAPLLELGAGFHPELTGMENIFLNSALLGYSDRMVKERLDSIVEFTELGDFIAAPLRTYSSGMISRLGFAVATAWRPDILVMDEVLGVGDEMFQKKCQIRIESFRKEGSTILIVSHSAAAIEELCQRAAWMAHGEINYIGDVASVLEQYRHGVGN